MTAAAAPVGSADRPTAAGGAARPVKPTNWPKAVVALTILAAITVWSAIAVQVDFGAIVRNINNATTTIGQLLQPDYTFFPQTLTPLLQTLEMAVISTAVSSLLALPISFLASRATNPFSPLLVAVRLLMNVVRSIPDLLYAALFVTAIATGAVSGILALVLFNVGILVKLISEALDGLDRGGQEAALAAGAGWLKADRAAMLPEVSPIYLSQVIYILELNIRASTVLGLVGAGGLGMLIDQVRTFFEYHYLSLVIGEILILVVALETFSSLARRRLVR